MGDIETIGSKCPVCGYTKCLIKYHIPFPSSWYTYQACTRCGFAYGEVAGETYTAQQVWDSLEDHFRMTRKELHERYRDAEADDGPFVEPIWNFTEEDVQNFRKLNMPVYA